MSLNGKIKPPMNANEREFPVNDWNRTANPEDVRFGFLNSFIPKVLLAFIRVHSRFPL
jgi:hypothetical protein